MSPSAFATDRVVANPAAFFIAPASSGPRRARSGWVLLAGVLTMLILAGCQAVPVYKQQRVGKPSMQFEDSTVFAYSCALLTQVEPGIALSGGAQATSCSACR